MFKKKDYSTFKFKWKDLERIFMYNLNYWLKCREERILFLYFKLMDKLVALWSLGSKILFIHLVFDQNIYTASSVSETNEYFKRGNKFIPFFGQIWYRYETIRKNSFNVLV